MSSSLATTIDIIAKVRYGVLIAGLVGNIATFVIFSRKAFRNSSIGVYSRALAIGEFCLLLIQFINQTFILFFKTTVFSGIAYLCKFSMYANFVLPSMSAWILVAFSVDKVLCILYPNRFEMIKKTSFQIKMILAIVIIHGLAFIEVPIFIEITGQTVASDCSTKLLSFYFVISIAVLIETYAVPFLIMSASSVLIIRALYQSRTRIEVHQNRDMKARKTKDLKFAVTSIVLNVLFIVLQSPISLSFLIPIQDRTFLAIFSYIGALCFSLNFAKLFFAYFVSNSIFRQELYKLFVFRTKHSSNESTNQTQSKKHIASRTA